MSVLVFIDQSEGHIKKSSFEAASYASKVAEQLGTNAEGIVLGNITDDVAALGNYGIKKPMPVVPGLEGSGIVVENGGGFRVERLNN